MKERKEGLMVKKKENETRLGGVAQDISQDWVMTHSGWKQTTKRSGKSPVSEIRETTVVRILMKRVRSSSIAAG